ncbi:MAG: hypothetical protein ABI091_22715 [Ferruginibacter sp.]
MLQNSVPDVAWLSVKMTLDESSQDFHTPDLALEVQRGESPGAPGGVELFGINLFYILINGIPESLSLSSFSNLKFRLFVRLLGNDNSNND